MHVSICVCICDFCMPKCQFDSAYLFHQELFVLSVANILIVSLSFSVSVNLLPSRTQLSNYLGNC